MIYGAGTVAGWNVENPVRRTFGFQRTLRESLVARSCVRNGRHGLRNYSSWRILFGPLLFATDAVHSILLYIAQYTYTHSHTHTFTYILYYRIIYRRLRSYSSLSNSFKFRHYGPPRRVDRPKRLGVLRVRTRYYNLLLLLCDEIWGLRQTRWRTRSIGPSRYGRHCGR